MNWLIITSILCFIFSFNIYSHNNNLFEQLDGNWYVISTNNINKSCYNLNFTNINNKILLEENYFENNIYKTNLFEIFYNKKHNFHSKEHKFNLVFLSNIKNIGILHKNNETLIISKYFPLNFDDYFYIGNLFNLFNLKNLNFINHKICYKL